MAAKTVKQISNELKRKTDKVKRLEKELAKDKAVVSSLKKGLDAAKKKEAAAKAAKAKVKAKAKPKAKAKAKAKAKPKL